MALDDGLSIIHVHSDGFAWSRHMALVYVFSKGYVVA